MSSISDELKVDLFRRNEEVQNMTEKKNYCVDGKCTVEVWRDCKFSKLDKKGSCKNWNWVMTHDIDFCESKAANAEWRQTNG